MDPRGFSGWRPGSFEYRRDDGPTGGEAFVARNTYLPRFFGSWPSVLAKAVIAAVIVLVLFLAAYAWLLAR